MKKGMSNRNCLFGCGSAGVVVFVFLMAGVALAYFLGPKPGQIRPNLNPIIVNITMPLNDAYAPLNQPASVIAEAFGDQPIKDLELTINGQPFSNRVSASPAGVNYMNSQWDWMPAKEGDYALLVRAVASDGQSAVSNVVNVKVVPQDKLPVVSEPTEEVSGTPIPEATPNATQQAEFLASILSGDPAPPPPGFNDQGIEPPPPSPQEDPNPGAPEEPPQQPGGILPSFILNGLQSIGHVWSPAQKPAAPKLDGGAKQCEAVLVIQDNSEDESGFYLYRVSPPSVAFEKIATLDPRVGQSTFSYHDPGLAGALHMYYVAAFNPAGESYSNIEGVKISDPACGAANPPQLEPESIPIDPGQAIDKLYCYGSASKMPWVRIPGGQDTFIYPVNGKFDLAPYWKQIPLPNPTPPKYSLNLECWGWSGDTLVYLGMATKKIDTSQNNPVLEYQVNPMMDLIQPDPTEVAMKLDWIAAPYNLHLAANAEECRYYENDPNYQNKAVLFCDQEMKKGKMILLWNWTPYDGCPPQKGSPCQYDYDQKIDGFRIYKLDKTPNSTPKMIAGSLPEVRYSSVQPLYGQGMFLQPEYFVRAVVAEGNPWPESVDSNHLNGQQGGITISIKNPYIRNKVGYMIRDAVYEDDAGPDWKWSNNDNGIGWDYHYGEFGKFWHHFLQEVEFSHEQMAQIKGKVTKAVLRFHKYKPDVLHDIPPCATLHYSYAMTLISAGPLQGNKDYDVTAIISSRVNEGHYANKNMMTTFFFNSRKCELPELSKGEEYECLQYFNNYELVVTYLPW